MPNRMFDLVEGVIPWHHRITAYALLLGNDRSPLVHPGPCVAGGSALSGHGGQAHAQG